MVATKVTDISTYWAAFACFCRLTECCLDGAAGLQQQGVQPPVAELCLEHEGALDLAHVHLLPPVHVQDGACTAHCSVADEMVSKLYEHLFSTYCTY